MKQCRLFLIAMAMAVASCQSDVGEEVRVVEQPAECDVASIYAISEEEAIENLNEFMAAFDGAETRANPRVVKRVESVKLDNVCATRSSEELDIDNLLYIVEFEDGQGSAVLGADRRLTPVYAVLDESVLTKDDFVNALNGEDTEDVATFTAGVIARSFDPNPDLTITPPGGGFNTDMYKDITTIAVLEYLPPLLNTKWGQSGIFNDKFPLNLNANDHQQAAGCVTIALAQILNYNSYPSPITLDGHTFYWRDINQFNRSNFKIASADSVLVDKMSNYIYRLAQDLDVTYGSDGSTYASIADARRVMRRNNYDTFSIGAINKARIYPMIYNNRPVYACGFNASGGGHAWVIDGWKKVQINHILITYDGFGVEKSRRLLSSTETDYVHCNMGYYGKCDGYYTLDLFDLRRLREGYEYEPDYGDIRDTMPAETHRFEYDLESLTYDY